MDPNGTRFHLLKGEADWLSSAETAHTLAWDKRSASLGLRRVVTLFRHPTGKTLDLAVRRGAAIDQFGNWYWIGTDRRHLVWHPSGGRQPQIYWSQVQHVTSAEPTGFQATPNQSPMAELAGLAVTENHYLVVGNITQGGVLIFDLHAGGEPLRLSFPQHDLFKPFDIAPAPGGGVWILDRQNRIYWGLDRNFQILGLTGPALSEAASAFHPVDHAEERCPERQLVSGFPVAAHDPVCIVSLKDGSVLIVDRLPVPTPSMLYHYRGTQQSSPPLPIEFEFAVDSVRDTGVGGPPERLSLEVHDLASDGDPHRPTLYLVDSAGKQVIVSTLAIESSPPALIVEYEYLPLRAFGGRGLVWDASHATVYYDLNPKAGLDTAVRWIPVQALEEPGYIREGTCLTPVFDGKEHNCLWDGLFLDACIPPETDVTVFSRADNDQALLETIPFNREPELYLRSAGAELPYYRPFVEPETQQPKGEAPASNPPTLPTGSGTWELLFQQARGRYMQLRLELYGNGRSTPRLHALRAYYPRFSYPENYLPAVYLEDPLSAGFLERLLANPKGFFNDIEAKIDTVSLLFDPRGAPQEALDWLASWIGLTLDPLWSELHRRHRAQIQPSENPQPDRRRLMIRFASRLYAWRGTANGLLFALELLLDPCLEAKLAQMERAMLTHDLGLERELRRLQLPYPALQWTTIELEELLFAYIVSPRRHAKVRIVERFRVRDGRAAALGDPTLTTTATAEDFAHRFSVLVPENLSQTETAMVERIVNLEKPAHTTFDIREYWDYLRVGEVRLGIDTILGQSGRFTPIILGRQALAEGHLEPAQPMDAVDRVILERDGIGNLPPL